MVCLWIADSGCSRHMTGNRSFLTNFVDKLCGTVKFGNDHMLLFLDMVTSFVMELRLNVLFMLKD